MSTVRPQYGLRCPTYGTVVRAPWKSNRRRHQTMVEGVVEAVEWFVDRSPELSAYRLLGQPLKIKHLKCRRGIIRLLKNGRSQYYLTVVSR